MPNSFAVQELGAQAITLSQGSLLSCVGPLFHACRDRLGALEPGIKDEVCWVHTQAQA